MPLPTKAQSEGITDSVAAMIAADIAGARQAALTPVTGGLYQQVDAISNPDIELALGPFARALDIQLWNESSLIQTVLDKKYGPFLGALQAQIKADGTYQNYDAYLAGIGAQVSPQIQAIAGSPTAFGANLSPGNVFSPAIAGSGFDAAYGGTDGGLTDLTPVINSAATADAGLFASNNDALYLRLNTKPSGQYGHLGIQLSTLASADIGLTATIWNGTAWVPLVHTDADASGNYNGQGTIGFTKSGVVRYTIPTNWERTNLNPAGTAIISSDLTPGYYIRLQRTAVTVVTTPIASVIRNGIGMGLVLIKSDSTATFIPGDSVNTLLYAAPSRLKLRALTNIGQNVTLTIVYINNAGTAGRTQAQSAWSSIAAGGLFPTSGSSYLTLQTALEGVRTITGATISTTATAGAFVIESLPARTEAK